MTSFGSIRDLIPYLFYLHINLMLLSTTRILKKKIHRGGIILCQKAAAAGTSEDFLEQRLFYGFRHRIFYISMLKRSVAIKNDYLH